MGGLKSLFLSSSKHKISWMFFFNFVKEKEILKGMICFLK